MRGIKDYINIGLIMACLLVTCWLIAGCAEEAESPLAPGQQISLAPGNSDGMGEEPQEELVEEQEQPDDAEVLWFVKECGNASGTATDEPVAVAKIYKVVVPSNSEPVIPPQGYILTTLKELWDRGYLPPLAQDGAIAHSGMVEHSGGFWAKSDIWAFLWNHRKVAVCWSATGRRFLPGHLFLKTRTYRDWCLIDAWPSLGAWAYKNGYLLFHAHVYQYPRQRVHTWEQTGIHKWSWDSRYFTTYARLRF